MTKMERVLYRPGFVVVAIDSDGQPIPYSFDISKKYADELATRLQATAPPGAIMVAPGTVTFHMDEAKPPKAVPDRAVPATESTLQKVQTAPATDIGCDPFENGYDPKNVERIYRARVTELQAKLAAADALLDWCRNRLKSPSYRATFDKYRASPPTPDHTPIKQSEPSHAVPSPGGEK